MGAFRLGIDADGESAEFEVATSLDTLKKFAQQLKKFPYDMHEIVELTWGSGKQYLAKKAIETGRLRLSAKVAEATGYSELKLELLEPKSFVPGRKLSIAVGTQPLLINQLGLSLETWTNQPSEQFSFSL